MVHFPMYKCSSGLWLHKRRTQSHGHPDQPLFAPSNQPHTERVLEQTIATWQSLAIPHCPFCGNSTLYHDDSLRQRVAGTEAALNFSHSCRSCTATICRPPYIALRKSQRVREPLICELWASRDARSAGSVLCDLSGIGCAHY